MGRVGAGAGAGIGEEAVWIVLVLDRGLVLRDVVTIQIPTP